MKLIQAIICVLSVSLAVSQVTWTSTPTNQFPSGNAAVTVSSTNGYLVTLSAAGWATSSDLTLTLASTTVTYVITTLVSTGTAATGVGLIATGGNGGSPYTCSPTAAFTTAVTTGKTPTSAPTATAPATASAVGACPVDFLTLYSAAPTGASTSYPASTTPATAANRLVIGVPVTWAITPAGSLAGTKCHQLTISAPGQAAVSFNAAGTCVTTDSEGYFAPGIAGGSSTAYTYAFYVTTESSAKVCFQSQAQYAAAPGTCGVSTTKSSNILSVLGAPLLLLSAILLN